MTIEEIRDRLRNSNVSKVAMDTKLSRQTVYNLVKDKYAKPTESTMKLITDWIALDDKRKKAIERVRQA